MKSKVLTSGESVFLAYGADHSMVCCGCCKVHGFTIAPMAGGILLTIWDDKEATKLERAKKREKKGAR